MSRHFIMWAFLCATAPVVCSQNGINTPPAGNDTTDCSIHELLLDEIVVTASPVIYRSDRQIIRPDKTTLDASADGIDLLRRLHLPRITVNPMTNLITATGGDEVVLCINGIESTASQIAAIRPHDISRIEYYDNPGLRYAGATAVIDYITVRNNQGGYIAFDNFSALANGRWATIDHLSGQYSRGASTWSINTGYMGQQKDQWLRDYDEIWHYPDEILTRHESGLPVTVGQSGLESRINYNYLHPSGHLFNLQLGLDLNDIPNQEEGDRKALLMTSGAGNSTEITEHTEEHSATPCAGLYYMHLLSERSRLIFDTQLSYMHSRMLHEYSENSDKEINHVRGNKYSMKLLAMYEYRAGSRICNIGVSNSISSIDNTYYQSSHTTLRINRSETAISGEYSDRFGNCNVAGGLRTSYHHISQLRKHLDRLSVSPSFTISYRPSGKWFMRYTASVDHVMPSAAEISDIVQPIQTGLVRRGNPGLHSFRVIEQSVDVSLESGFISAAPHVEYRHEHRPIMESVIYEQGQFVRTYRNQRSFQRLTIGGTVSLHPWSNHLTITADPQLRRYFSRGVDYNHFHNIFRLGLGIDFSYGKWLAYANVISGPANSMYGEEIIEEKDMNQIMAGYTHGIWTLHIGVFNAFMKKYWMKTLNLSRLTPYTSKAHSARSSSYFAVKFNIALDFGRGRRNIDIRDTDTDTDNGILTGTK